MNKSTKARKYDSPKLKALLAEITPVEMEQTKVKMQLAACIEDLMHANGMSKSQFANKVGKQPSEVTKWLSGTQNFTTDVLTEIALSLGVEVSALFGKKEQTQLISKTVFVVSAVVKQQPLTISTPISEHYKFLSNKNFMSTIPLTPFSEEYYGK